MLTFPRLQWLQMVAAALDANPLEGCGLLFGKPAGDQVIRFVPVRNEAQSETIYRLDPQEYLDAVLAAEGDGLETIGVMHSHTRSAAYPSPTDVAEAAKPLIPAHWHWVIVSLALGYPELRSFRIGDGGVAEEPVVCVADLPFVETAKSATS